MAKNVEEIGVEGYKKIFLEYRKLIKRAHEEKIFNDHASNLPNEYKFIGLQIILKEHFCYGEFMKYHHSDLLVDIYNDKEAQKIAPNLSAKKIKYEFVFDFENHALAINHSRLPSYKRFQEALEKQFKSVIKKLYPDHYLSINELTEDESLQEVLGADSYKSVNVEVSFSNSDVSEEELEKELKESAVGTSTLIQKAPKDGSMALTKTAKAYLNLAKAHGDATVSYIKNRKKKIYQMFEKPVKKKIKQQKEDSDSSFINNVYYSIKWALDKTKK